jgi:hypothetical protein
MDFTKVYKEYDNKQLSKRQIADYQRVIEVQ